MPPRVGTRVEKVPLVALQHALWARTALRIAAEKKRTCPPHITTWYVAGNPERTTSADVFWEMGKKVCASRLGERRWRPCSEGGVRPSGGTRWMRLTEPRNPRHFASTVVLTEDGRNSVSECSGPENIGLVIITRKNSIPYYEKHNHCFRPLFLVHSINRVKRVTRQGFSASGQSRGVRRSRRESGQRLSWSEKRWSRSATCTPPAMPGERRL